MDNILGQNDDLLSVGARYAHDAHALCNDVAAIIFPTAMVAPSDAVVSSVTLKLVQLVGDIERQLRNGPDIPSQPVSWPLLARSGFLREADLVDFVLARVAEDRLEARLDDAKATLPVQLLDHPDSDIAQAAQMLLAADSLHRQARGTAYLALPAELLHKICWRVVAALEVHSGARSPATIAAADQMLMNYDEALSIKVAARKIVHFMGETRQALLLQPQNAGLHLYVAAISAALEIDHDHVLRLIEGGSSAPFAIIQSALGVTKDAAAAAIILLRGEALTPREAGAFDTGYASLNRDQARAEITKWSMARAQYLAFGTT